MNNHYKLLPLLTCLTLFLTITEPLAKTKPPISIIAKIDNQIITNVDLVDRYRFLLLISKISINSKQEKLLLINQLLQKMIDEKLQLNEAKKLELSLEEGQLNESVEKIAISQSWNLHKFKIFFRKNSLSYENYLQQIKSQLLWNKIISKAISPGIKISEIEIRELLELNKIETKSLRLFLAEIYIPFDYEFHNRTVDAKNLANKLVQDLRKNKKSSNFSSIAEQFSRSATAEFGGEIGWIEKNDIDTQIYNVISKLEIGEISNPIIKNNGYYLFKIIDKKSVDNLEENDINQIKSAVFRKKLRIAAKSYLMDLRKKSFIEIDQENLISLNNSEL